MSVPVRSPIAEGVKVTATDRSALLPTNTGSVEGIEKSLPVTLADIHTLPPEVLVAAKVLVSVVVSGTLPKSVSSATAGVVSPLVMSVALPRTSKLSAVHTALTLKRWVPRLLVPASMASL